MTLRFGRRFTPDLTGVRRDHQAVADQVGAHIAALLPEEYRGVYAEAVEALGHPHAGGE